MDYTGLNIRRERVKARLSQFMLAKAIGIGQGAISRYENGTRLPSVRMIKKLAIALKCPFTRLVGEEFEPSSIANSLKLAGHVDDFDEIFFKTMFDESPKLTKLLCSLSKRCDEMTSDHWDFLTNHLMFAFGQIEAFLDREKRDREHRT